MLQRSPGVWRYALSAALSKKSVEEQRVDGIALGNVSPIGCQDEDHIGLDHGAQLPRTLWACAYGFKRSFSGSSSPSPQGVRAAYRHRNERLRVGAGRLQQCISHNKQESDQRRDRIARQTKVRGRTDLTDSEIITRESPVLSRPLPRKDR